MQHCHIVSSFLMLYRTTWSSNHQCSGNLGFIQQWSVQLFPAFPVQVLRDLFQYKPILSRQQFLQWGFSHRKISLLCDIINLVLQKHSQLKKVPSLFLSPFLRWEVIACVLELLQLPVVCSSFSLTAEVQVWAFLHFLSSCHCSFSYTQFSWIKCNTIV